LNADNTKMKTYKISVIIFSQKDQQF